VKKLRIPAIVYKKPALVYEIAPSGNSELAGRKIVGVASIAKCWRQKLFRGDLYSLSTFYLVASLRLCGVEVVQVQALDMPVTCSLVCS